MKRLIKLQKKSLRLLEYGKIHTEPICKKYGMLTINDEYIKNTKLLAWQIIKNMSPEAIRKEFNWVRNDIRPLRRQRRVITTRFRNTNLSNQAIKRLETYINQFSNDEINLKIGLMKKRIKTKLLNKYNEEIRCNNMGCSECSA